MYSIQDDDDGSAPSVASAETSSVANSTSASAASTVDQFKLQLINLLNVPAHLTGLGDMPLSVACSTLESMVAGRT